MNDNSNVEFVGKMKPKKLTSMSEDFKREQVEIIADREHWAKYGTNRSSKSGKSKSQIREELTRERFPCEE